MIKLSCYPPVFSRKEVRYHGKGNGSEGLTAPTNTFDECRKPDEPEGKLSGKITCEMMPPSQNLCHGRSTSSGQEKHSLTDNFDPGITENKADQKQDQHWLSSNPIG
jgi:hypothetical protein